MADGLRSSYNGDWLCLYNVKYIWIVDSILQMQNGKDRQNEKKNLIEEVITWSKENPELAKAAFQESASEIIKLLKQIESVLAIDNK